MSTASFFLFPIFPIYFLVRNRKNKIRKIERFENGTAVIIFKRISIEVNKSSFNFNYGLNINRKTFLSIYKKITTFA